MRATWLVGADGGRSTVRKTLGVPFPGVTDESIRMLLGDVAADGLDREHVHWFGSAPDPRKGIVLSPLPGTDQFQFGAPRGGEPTLDGLQALVDRFTAGVRLHDLTWSTVWRPNVRLAERFRVGRVFLAGDAAHVHPPTGGQGLNTGVQDAYNLGWKLADGSSELLDTYETERRAVAEAVLGLSTRIMKRYADGDADAHERPIEARQLGLSYRTEPAGVLAAGDRAPDAPLVTAEGTAIRLFDLFRGPHATTLAFEPNGGVVVGSVAFVDVEGYAFAAYGATRAPSSTSRPDGYVGRDQGSQLTVPRSRPYPTNATTSMRVCAPTRHHSLPWRCHTRPNTQPITRLPTNPPSPW